MVTSLQIIEYLKKNLDKENFVSVFLAGSKPKELVSESDLDIFVILNEKRINEALDNLSGIMEKFVSENKQVAYCFFRGGAMKHKDKGLIHFVVYENKEDFKENELLAVLENLLKTSELVSGKPPKEILRGVDFNDKQRKEKERKGMIENYNLFKTMGKIMTKRWIKKAVNWNHIELEEFPDKFFRKQIDKYYKKHYPQI